MHDWALRVSPGRSLLALLVGLSLSTAGCSPKPTSTEKRPPTTKHLKYIDELLKKGAAPKTSPNTKR